MKLISIIIPIYNVEKYISKCISSVYDQDLEYDQFEVIIVDDESPDNSLEIAKNIAIDHANINIISQKNKGLGGARNTGILNAEGKYLLFLDSDDYLLPNTLHNITKIAQNDELDILEFGAEGITSNGDVVYRAEKTTEGKIYDGVAYYNTLKYMNSACNKLYKRELLVENKLLFLEQLYLEDFEFNTRVFLAAKRVMAINNIVAHYLQSPDSITRNTSLAKKEKMLSDLVKIIMITKQLKFDYATDITNKDLDNYFGTRLSFLNVTLFYQLFKNSRPYKKFKQIKEQLEKEGGFCVSSSLEERSKDLFRKIMLKNFWLFKFTQPLKSLFAS
ncbi:glycosyltransferase [Spongiivirga sp. MCCC 1A20706]|uniref:glycosyltransferase family 2 protein n=1 Tax=Spongiivirga sp. MCCC 1A20706 TaxID=3160963 RepID=UPI0039774B8F